MGIGKKIRNIRVHQGMTQKELGEKLGGISQQQIGRWENERANPKIETIQKIAAALNVPLSDITSFREEIHSIAEGKITVIPDSFASDYAKLNDTGKREAEKRVHELTEIPRYTNKDVQLPDNKD